MKKLSLIALLVIMPAMVYAQDAIPVLPDWVDGLLAFIASIPAVGPYIASGIKILGTVSVVLTALSAVLMAIDAAVEKMKDYVDKNGKIDAALDAAIAFIAKIQPWIQYLSLINASKKK